MKDKLIQLFDKTCDNYDIPRDLHGIGTDIHYNIQYKIRNTIFPETIQFFERYDTMKNRKYFYKSDLHLYDGVGFNFKDLPTLFLCNIRCSYHMNYKKSYFGLGTQRKNALKELRSIKESGIFYDTNEYCEEGGAVRGDCYKNIIVQGTLFTEITDMEWSNLRTKYYDSICKYDLHKLNERLK